MIAILVNGCSLYFFKPSRGLREGDPLSPIMADFLGRYIGNLVSLGVIKGLQPSYHPLIFSHEKFVDDTIFLGKDEIREARNLKNSLISILSYLVN